MSTYILLISATEAGREKILNDTHVIRSIEDEMGFAGAEILGLYAVLSGWRTCCVPGRAKRSIPEVSHRCSTMRCRRHRSTVPG